MNENDTNQIVLCDDARRILEDLVCQCIEFLQLQQNIIPSCEDQQQIAVRGHLYALHVRSPENSIWCFKYVGKSHPEDIMERILQHLNGSNTNDKYDKVSAERAKGNEVGVSSINITTTPNDLQVTTALSNYVETRIFDWLKCEEQTRRWGQPWNNRRP